MKESWIFELAKLVRDYLRLFRKQRYVSKFSKMNRKQLMMIDAAMYKERQHKSLDWSNLRTYTEKMQWEKLFDEDHRKTVCADKYLVREWVENKIGGDYLIPLIGVWDSIGDVDFSSFPDQFVIKTNHGSGDVIVVSDKKKLDLAKKIEIWRKISVSMKTDYSTIFCEMHYSKIKPKVLVEEYIGDGSSDLSDYKFLCFDGVPHYCWVDMDRFTNHTRNVYDMNWNLQSWNQGGYDNYKDKIDPPKNFEEMKKIAEALSAGFKHVRVDLYNVQGKVYFGEMTFTNGSGFEELVPESADVMLGDLWKIDMGNNLIE